MSSRRQGEPSPLCWGGDLIDQLIYQSLLGEVEGTEPSPRVWESICQRIVATDVCYQAKDAGVRVPLLLDSVLTLLKALFADSDWETRLAKHQRPAFWLLPFSSSLVLAA